MAKNDKQQVNNASKQERATSNQQFDTLTNTVNQNLATQTAAANDQNSFATQGYKDIYSRGGIDPTVAANLRALGRPGSNALGSGSSSGNGGGGGGSGDAGGSGGGNSASVPAVKADPFATSRGAFQNFIATGGVDMGAMKEALPGYRDIAKTGGYSEADLSSLNEGIGRLSDIGKTGGYDPATLAKINANIGNLSEIGQTGGFSPEALGLIKNDIAGLRSIGQTGGVSQADIARARGNGVFDEFAATGGYSPADISNLRARGISPISAQYGTDLANIEQSNRLLGRAAPNFSASVARLNRNRGLGLADATRNVEMDIAGKVREGKMSGAKALSQAELDLQKMLTGNKLTGLQSSAQGEGDLANAIAQNRTTASTAASTQMQNLQNAINDAKLAGNTEAVAALTNLRNSIAGNQLSALGGITTTQQGAEEIGQKGKLAGAEGMFGVEQASEAARLQEEAQRAAASAASGYNDAISAGQRAEDERWWAQFMAGNEQYLGSTGLEGQMAALGGLNNLYGTAPGAQGQNYEAALNSIGGRGGTANNFLQTQLASSGPSIMDRVMQGAGIASGVMTGLGGLGGNTQRLVSNNPNVSTAGWSGLKPSMFS